MTAGLPKILINMSMTADGKIASENRRISSFGSRQDQENLHRLRSKVDAILCGARTVDLNRVSMGNGPRAFHEARMAAGLEKFPLRIIATGKGTLDPRAFIFGKKLGPIVILTSQLAGRSKLAALQKLSDEVYVDPSDEIHFREAFVWLKKKWGVHTLLCEGGGALNDALIRARLVDELHLTICPFVLGGRKAPTIADGQGAANLASCIDFRIKSSRKNGNELFLVLSPKKQGSTPRLPGVALEG